MFRKVDVPVLGIIENMSWFACPHCGERTDIFGHGGAQAEAARLGVDFLGEVPLDIRIRETSDAGTPIVAADPASPHAAAYRAIAQRLWAKIGRDTRPPPRIVVSLKKRVASGNLITSAAFAVRCLFRPHDGCHRRLQPAP